MCRGGLPHPPLNRRHKRRVVVGWEARRPRLCRPAARPPVGGDHHYLHCQLLVLVRPAYGGSKRATGGGDRGPGCSKPPPEVGRLNFLQGLQGRGQWRGEGGGGWAGRGGGGGGFRWPGFGGVRQMAYPLFTGPQRGSSPRPTPSLCGGSKLGRQGARGMELTLLTPPMHPPLPQWPL